MKPVNNFILLLVALTLPMLLTCHTARAQSVSIPFTEDWSSGNFYQNGWEFTPAQGNWTISQVGGDHAADFSWDPPQTDYGFMLVSPVIDGTPWSCASFWLDFDYKLVDMNVTGNEKLIIELFYNNVWDTLAEVSNLGSVNWKSRHLAITQCQGNEFRIGFRATGAHSNDILHWYVDNVHVYTECRPPRGIYCVPFSHSVYLSWLPPNCIADQILYYIYDDGTNENSWSINPGFLAWLGNEFPISVSSYGILKSFDVWFEHNPSHGGEKLTLDVFDASHNLLGSSAPFTPPDNSWLTVPVNDIPFSGPFFGMVKWNNLTSSTNNFGYDENGPYASADLAWYSDGTDWENLSVAAGTAPGVFLMRAKALVSTDKSIVAIDSSTLLGYNVYRTSLTCVAPYSLLTPAPINSNTYTDIVEMGLMQCYQYFVTAVFENSANNQIICTPSSDTLEALYWIGMDELRDDGFKIYPTPASQAVTISGTSPIRSIEMTNFLGETIYLRREINEQNCMVDVIGWSSGIYFVKVTDDKQSGIIKLVVQR